MAVSLYESHRPREATITVSVSPDFSGDYVAVGADMEVDVNAALVEALALGGGEVVLLQGTYTLAASITFPGNSLVLRGMGRATFIDVPDLAPTTFHGIVMTGRTDCTIKNLSIQTAAGGGDTVHPIFIEDGSDRFRVENVWVVNSDDDGIRVEGTTISTGYIVGCQILAADGDGILVDMDAANFAYRIHVEDCDIGNCGTSGIRFSTSDGNDYCEIINNIVYSCTDHGIYLRDSNHSMVRGNICLSNGVSGIFFITTDHCQALGNTCLGNTDNGIQFNQGHNSTVVGNTFQGNTLNGIYLLNSDDCTVVGNTCQGNTLNGIWLDTGANYSSVTGNNCNGNTVNGIYLNNSDDCTVVGNTCQGNTETGIYLYQLNDTTVSGNICPENTQHGIYLELSNDNSVTGNTCKGNDSGDTGSYDGIHLNSSFRNLVLGNQCQENDRWGIMVDDNSDNNKISNNYTNDNTAGSINVNGATCANNQVEFNTVEEGAPVNTGTNTRAYGNYDPSANAFVGDMGAAPF